MMLHHSGSRSASLQIWRAPAQARCPAVARKVQVMAVAAPMVDPANMKAQPLYLLHWHAKHPGNLHEDSANSEKVIHALKSDLKMLEKVTKEAVWFTTKEAQDGQHVLMVTNDSKLAKKYQLAELVEGETSVALPGGVDVQIPVADLQAALAQQLMMEEDSESESDTDDDDGMGMQKTKAEKEMESSKNMKADESDSDSEEDMDKMLRKEAKKKQKEAKKMEKEAKKAAKKNMERESQMAMDDDSESDEEESSGSESEDGMQPGMAPQAGIVPMQQMAGDDSDTSDEESSGSESEDDMMPAAAGQTAAMPVQPMQDDESDASSDEESSGSESEDETMMKTGAQPMMVDDSDDSSNEDSSGSESEDDMAMPGQQPTATGTATA